MQRQEEVQRARRRVAAERHRELAGGLDLRRRRDQVVPGLDLVLADAGLLQQVRVVEQAEGLRHPADRVLLAVQGVLLVGGVEEVLQEVVAELLLQVGGDAAGAVGQRPRVRREDLRYVAAGHRGLQRRQVLVRGAEDPVLDLDVRVPPGTSRSASGTGPPGRCTRTTSARCGIAAAAAGARGWGTLVSAAGTEQRAGAQGGRAAESGLEKRSAAERGCAGSRTDEGVVFHDFSSSRPGVGGDRPTDHLHFLTQCKKVGCASPISSNRAA